MAQRETPPSVLQDISPARGEIAGAAVPHLDFHPLANLFPLIEGEDFDELVEDVRRHGVRDSIVLLDGKILDGRNRFRAGVAAGFFTASDEGGWPHPQYMFDRFEIAHAGEDPLAWVVSKNLRRRHLTESQRAMVAGRLANMAHGGRRRGDQDPNSHLDRVRIVDAAKQLDIGRSAVAEARTVLRDGAQELQEAVDQRKVSVHLAAQLAALPVAEQKEILATAADPRALKQVAKDVRRRQQEEGHARRMALAAEKATGAAPLPEDRKYAVIYADPPWLFSSHSDVTGREKSPENHYPTMPTEEIMRLPCPAAETAVLYLWVPASMMLIGAAVMTAWGFEYVSQIVWNKTYGGDRTGTGHWVRSCHELLLIGKRGGFPAPLPGTQPKSVFTLPVGEHSVKPAEFAETIERLYPMFLRRTEGGEAKAIELFCRSPRPGWDCWGNEVGFVEGAAVDAARPSSPPIGGRGGEPRLPPAPGLHPVEFTVGGLRKRNQARFAVSRNADGTFATSYDFTIGWHGAMGPMSGHHATFADALCHELGHLAGLFAIDADREDASASARAAAKAGLRWCHARAEEWGTDWREAPAGKAVPA